MDIATTQPRFRPDPNLPSQDQFRSIVRVTGSTREIESDGTKPRSSRYFGGGYALPQGHPRFDRIGVSFAAAVVEANRRAAATSAAPTQAVLQGLDGAYYVTAVGHDDRPSSFDGVEYHHYAPTAHADHDGWQSFHTAERVTRLSEAVKAVVGARSWANFTDTPVQIGLSELRHATVKRRGSWPG